MSVPRRVVVALAGVLTVAALGGCGGDESDQPRPLPPYTASPSSPATTSPSATPSTSATLERSAEDFVRAYFRELEDAQHTSRVAVLQRNVYDPSCQPCQFELKVINGLKRKGERIEGYEIWVRLL